MGNSVQATTGTLRRTANTVLSGTTDFTVYGAAKFPAAAATDPQAFTIEGFNTTATFELAGLGQNDVADGDDIETLIRLPGGTTHIDTITNAAGATLWLHFGFTWNHTTAAFTFRVIASGFNSGAPSYLVNSSGTAATPNSTTNAFNIFNNRFGDGGLNVLLGHFIITPLEMTEAQLLAAFAQRLPTSVVTSGGSYSYLPCTSAAAIGTDAGTLAANFTVSGSFSDSTDQPSEWAGGGGTSISIPTYSSYITT